MKTVLCYGDSNTFGYEPLSGTRYPKEKRWTTILQKRLGEEFEVIPEGLNGRTTAYDRPDNVWKNGFPYLAPCIASNKPVDYIVFMLGTNDCNADLNLTPEDIAAGMERLIINVEEENPDMQDYLPKMIIVAPAAIREGWETSPFADQLDENSVLKSHAIAPLYKAVAEKHGCMFLDCTDELEVSSFDCEHLTEKGHARLAELLAELILG